MSTITAQPEASLTEFIDTFSFDIADAISMADGDHESLLRELLLRLFSKDRYDLRAVADAVKAEPRAAMAAIKSATTKDER